jgi:hypothetical protein
LQTLAVAQPEVRITEALDRPALAAVKLSRVHPLASLATAAVAALAIGALMGVAEVLVAQPGAVRGAWLVAWRAVLESVVLTGGTLLIGSTWLRTRLQAGLLLGAAAVGLQTAAVVLGCFLPLMAFVAWAGTSWLGPVFFALLSGLLALSAFGISVSRALRAADFSVATNVMLGLLGFSLPVFFAVRCFLIAEAAKWN